MTGGNVYFDLTRTFNERGPIAALASGQAVVYYRVAIMARTATGSYARRQRPAGWYSTR